MVDSDANFITDLAALRMLMQKYIQMIRGNYANRPELKANGITLRSHIEEGLALVPRWSKNARNDMLKSTGTKWCTDDIEEAWYDLTCRLALFIRDVGLSKTLLIDKTCVRIADDQFQIFLNNNIEDATSSSEEEEYTDEEEFEDEEIPEEGPSAPGPSPVLADKPAVPSPSPLPAAPPAVPATPSPVLPKVETPPPASTPATAPVPVPVLAEVAPLPASKPRARKEKGAESSQKRKLFGGVKEIPVPGASKEKA